MNIIFRYHEIAEFCHVNHMDKKRTNASMLKDLGEYQIFSPLRIKGKTIEKQNIPLGLKYGGPSFSSYFLHKYI